jgi:hypothetical protein
MFLARSDSAHRATPSGRLERSGASEPCRGPMRAHDSTSSWFPPALSVSR